MIFGCAFVVVIKRSLRLVPDGERAPANDCPLLVRPTAPVSTLVHPPAPGAGAGGTARYADTAVPRESAPANLGAPCS